MPGSRNSTVIMFFYVYVLQSKNYDRLYIGFTSDLSKRLKEHNQGLNFSTKAYKPWRLIFYEAYRNREDATRRERYFKTSQGMRLLQRMLKEYLYEQKYDKSKN